VIRDSRRDRVLPPPTLDSTQRTDGYNKSLALRQARAELKKDLKAGKLTLRDVVGWDWVQGMKVHDLLRAVPTFGAKKAARLMSAALISPTHTVGRLGPRQVERLLAGVEQ
jgi:hypothetical protein